MEGNPILQGQLAEDNSIPLYYQLVSIIKRNISAGILKPGDLLPSEAEICKAYNISRTTARQAFAALEDDGLVQRRRGKGTFISSPKLRRRLDNLYSFSNDMNQQGLKPSSRMLVFEIINPSIDLQKSLKLTNESDMIYKIVRVRIADDEPLLIETTYVPVNYCPFLKPEMLKNDSLYRILREEAMLNPFYAIETYEPAIIKKEEASILKCKPGMCGFFIERTSFLETGEVFEFTQSLTRGDRCKFEVELYKNSVNFSRKISINE